MKTDEDDEFDRIERENRPKSSGMECCTYDCIQGRDCPIRTNVYLAQLAKEAGMEGDPSPKVLDFLHRFAHLLRKQL